MHFEETPKQGPVDALHEGKSRFGALELWSNLMIISTPTAGHSIITKWDHDME